MWWASDGVELTALPDASTDYDTHVRATLRCGDVNQSSESAHRPLGKVSTFQVDISFLLQK